MEITKEYLETQKIDLERGMQQTINNLNATQGAIKYIDMLLDKLAESEDENDNL